MRIPSARNRKHPIQPFAAREAKSGDYHLCDCMYCKARKDSGIAANPCRNRWCLGRGLKLACWTLCGDARSRSFFLRAGWCRYSISRALDEILENKGDQKYWREKG